MIPIFARTHSHTRTGRFCDESARVRWFLHWNNPAGIKWHQYCIMWPRNAAGITAAVDVAAATGVCNTFAAFISDYKIHTIIHNHISAMSSFQWPNGCCKIWLKRHNEIDMKCNKNKGNRSDYKDHTIWQNGLTP